MARAEDLKAPYGDGTNPTTVRFFTCTSSSRADEIPKEWSGQYVQLTNETANMAQYFFSTNASASVNQAIAAADNGAPSPNLGDSILGNTTLQVLLPHWQEPAKMYFVRSSGTSTSLRVRQRSN